MGPVASEATAKVDRRVEGGRGEVARRHAAGDVVEVVHSSSRRSGRRCDHLSLFVHSLSLFFPPQKLLLIVQQFSDYVYMYAKTSGASFMHAVDSP